jgi:hypothetical protein
VFEDSDDGSEWIVVDKRIDNWDLKRMSRLAISQVALRIRQISPRIALEFFGRLLSQRSESKSVA